MPFSPERKIILGSCAALLALVLLSVGGWWSAGRLDSTFSWVDHTHQVLYELEALRSRVLGIQTESQRYVITGDDTCLTRWAEAVKQSRYSLERLGELTGDNPEQYRRVMEFEPRIDEVILLTRQRHEIRQREGTVAAAAEVGKGRVRHAVDELTRLVNAATAVERDLLQRRTAETRSAGHIAVGIVFVTSALAAGLIVFSLVFSLRDLARRQRAEAELDRFFKLSHDLLCIAGFDGYFKRVNPAWEKTLGYTAAELTALPFMDFIHPDDREPTKAQAARQAGGLDAMSFENRYRCKDGSYRWLQWNARPLTSEQLIFATARDVTERKAAEDQIRGLHQQLQGRATQLEVLNRELEAFSYSVSHDLRAPLRHIDGFAGLLQRHASALLDDQGRRYISVISAAAQKMGRLIDDLLSFSRMGRSEMHVAEVDQGALVAAVIRDGAFDRAEPAVTWQIASLPAIRCDGAMLRQVWHNLIANAVKYSSHTPQPRIEIGAQPGAAAGEVVFFVKDNGVGFDMKYVEKLFGVFLRLHTEVEFEGTGIGLANVRRIVTRHGGRTWAEGCVGAGSTFYFSLPLPPSAAASPA